MRVVRPTTLRRDRGLIDTYLLPVFDGTLLSAIAVEDIQALLARVVRGQSSSTARRLLAVLGKILGDAVKSDYIRENPVERIDPRDKPRTRKNIQAIDVDKLLNLLRALPQEWAVLSMVAVLTGLRWGELAGLEWSDVDFVAGQIYVRRAIPAGAREPQDLKSVASNRSVDMVWPVRQVLLDLVRHGPLTFPGPNGGPLNHRWFHRRIWVPMTSSPERGLRFHDLRHSFASLLLAWGEPILYVSEQLGHASAAFTLATYARLIRQGRRLDKEETLQKLLAATMR